MNEKNLKNIMELRKKLQDLDENLEKIKNKNSFFSFFLKSLIFSLIFLLIISLAKTKTPTKIMVFVGAFIISNFAQSILISKKQNEEIEKIKREKIKIQAEIFSLAKDLENWKKF